MKRKYVWFTIPLFCLLIWLPYSSFSADSINWYTYSEGLTLGKSEKKIVFLHFYADWCRYCKKMTQETFMDSSVIAYLNANFVSIRVNSDKEKKLASDYGVRGLPTTWFLKENGEKVGPIPGYISPDKLLLMLKKIHTKENSTDL
jgi:thioredoxin-related protein